MQHEPIDSNSTASNFAGISFPSVFPPLPIPSVTSKVIIFRIVLMPLAKAFQKIVCASLQAAATWYRGCVAVNGSFHGCLMVARNKQRFLNMRRRIPGWRRVALSLAGLGEWLWLMLEAKRGLRV
jgi:hypothetical protein